jgi:hypothetical protein
LLKKKVLFHHDNAPAHTSVVAMANWSNCTTNCCPIHRIWHRATFFLFPNLRKSLTGQKFQSNEEVIAATENCFADLEKKYFSDGLKKSNSAEILMVAV